MTSPVINTPDARLIDYMVQRAAEALSTSMSKDPAQWAWYVEHVQVVLSAALAGYTPVQLPEPDARSVRAWLEYWNDNPVVLPQEERFALQRLANILEARRLAADSQVGDQT